MATAVTPHDDVLDGPELDLLVSTVRWLRQEENRLHARVLIGDISSGY